MPKCSVCHAVKRNERITKLVQAKKLICDKCLEVAQDELGVTNPNEIDSEMMEKALALTKKQREAR